MRRRYRNVDIVDRDTGEVVNEGREMPVEEVEENEREAVRDGKFGKIWEAGMEEELEEKEIVIVWRLMKYVYYDDNTIRKEGEAMNVKEMAEVTGVSYARLSEWIDKLIKRRIIGIFSSKVMKGYKGRRKLVYVINPHIFCKAVMIPKEIMRYFSGGGEIEERKKRKKSITSRD